MDNISEKLMEISRFPKRRGAIFQMEADDKGLSLVDVKSGTLKIYVLIDPEINRILDVKFFTYGGPVLTALAEIFCEELIGKNIENISEISLSDLFAPYGITSENPDFEIVSKLPAMAVEEYPEKKKIALAARAAMGSAKLKAFSAEGRKEADDDWFALAESEKLARIENTLNGNVRTMLAGDGGGIEVVKIKEQKHVIIRYNGACAGCGASSGGTLYYIEDQLRQNVYYDLSVEPEIITQPINWGMG